MKTILVTGATGYIGSHICKCLKQSGYIVIGVDRVLRKHTLRYMDRFLQADYASDNTYQLLDKITFLAVVHCAGTSLVGPSMSDPAEYYVNNVAKTAEFLKELSVRSPKTFVVFSSSAAVYGSPDADIIYENQALNPISPYGQSKMMIEQVLKDHHRAYDLSSMSLRYFNACGADVDDADLGQEPGATHIVARLLESIKNKKTFTLYGNDYNTPDGTCVRDYVHVNDLATAHMLAIQYLESFGGCHSINLGSGHGYSNQEILDAVEFHIGSVDIQQGPRRDGDPDRLVAGNLLASTTLGWCPKHSDLGTIVTSAWKWYNNPSDSVDRRPKYLYN